MANLLVTTCQKILSHSNGFLFQRKWRLRGIKIKVTMHFYLLYILSSRRFFGCEFTSIDLFVCGYVSFLMYLSFPFLLKRDVIFIKKGQLSMYQRRILMYLPRIKLACVHHKALCIDSFAGYTGTYSSPHLRSPCKNLKKNVCCSRLFGVTGNCAACSKLIPAFEMVMRAKDNVYHLDCFACQLCNQR